MYIWAVAWQNQQTGCALSKDWNQPGIRPVWSESLLSAWRHLGSFNSYPMSTSEVSDQTGRMPRLIFAGHTGHFVGFCHDAAQIWITNALQKSDTLDTKKNAVIILLKFEQCGLTIVNYKCFQMLKTEWQTVNMFIMFMDGNSFLFSRFHFWMETPSWWLPIILDGKSFHKKGWWSIQMFDFWLRMDNRHGLNWLRPWTGKFWKCLKIFFFSLTVPLSNKFLIVS